MKNSTFIKNFILMLLFAASQSTFAITPSDNCGTSGSQQITVNTNSCNTTSFDFSSSIGSPSLTGTCASGGTQDGWGWFTATGTSTTITVTPDVNNNDRNVALLIYSGSCGSLTLVSCVNAQSSSNPETTTITTVNGTTYSVRVVRMSGTSSDADNDICVVNNVAPAVTGFSPSAGCVGSVITINGTNLSSASSVKIGGTTASVLTNSSTVITATVGSGTTGTVSVTTAGGTGTSVGTFTVNPLPTQYTVSGGGAYCSGGAGMPVNLSNSELGVDYQLKLGAGNVGAPIAGTGAGLAFGNQTAAGTYTVVATNTSTTCNRTMSGNAVVTINAITSITTQPTDKTACEGSNTNVSLVAAGASLTYQWQDNSSGSFANISGATNATYNLNGVTLAMNGRQYKCIVNGACGSVTSNTVTLTVNAKPVAVATPSTQTLCEGVAITNIDLSVSNGLLGTTYSWSRNNTGTLTGISNSGSTNPITGTLNSSSSSAQTTTFTITPTSSAGCVGSTFTSAVIVNPSTVISTQPAAQTKCEGTSASYSVSAQGVSLTYQWQDNSSGSFADIAGATSSSYNLSSVTVGMNGWQYRCIVTGTCGVLTSNNAALTVTAYPTASVSPGTMNVCGSSQLLTASTGASSPSYQWKLNGNNISSATNATFNVTGSANGSYTVVITKNSCATTSAASALSFYAAPVAAVTPGTSSACSGANKLLASTPQPASNLTPVTENFNGVSTITVANGSGNAAACAWTSRTSPYTASSTTFNSGDNKFMLANSDAGGSGSTTNTTLVSATFSTAGYSTLSLSFKQFYQHYSSDVTVAVEVSTNGGSSWTSAASYIGVDQGTSTAFVTSTVNLNAYVSQPNFKFRFNYVTSYGWFWAIDNVVLTGTPVVYQYSWAANTGSGVNGLPAGTGSYSVNNDSITVNATGSSNYTMSVMDMTTGCVSTAASALTVNPLPNVTITPSGATAFCAGGNVTLSAPAGLSSYSWNTLPVQTTQSIVVNTASNYTVVGTNVNGCSNNATQTITVYDTLPASITVIGSTNLCTGQTTTDLQATQTNAVSYVWNTTEPTSLITVAAAGIFSVTAIDNHGCEHHKSQVITETAAPAAPIVVPMSSTVLCSDGVTTSTVVLSTTNYTTDLLWSTSETTQDITVDYSDIFNVTYTDANGCFSASNSIATEVKLYSVDPTAITSAAGNSICAGSGTTLSVQGGSLGDDAVWKWYEGNCSGTALSTGSSLIVNPASTTTYFVRAEGPCNTTNCVQVTVIVKTLSVDPTAASPSSPILCGSGNSNLSVNGGSLGTGANWIWYEGGCANGTAIGTGATLNVTPSATTTYFVRAEGDCNISNCVQATVTVKTLSVDPTLASNNAVYNEVCNGSPVQLTVNGGSLGSDADWVWYEGNCASGVAVATGAVVSVTPSGGGTHNYFVRAEGYCNNTNCVNGSVLVRTSGPGSTVTSVAAPASACAGNTGALSINAVSNAAYYSWSGPSGVTFNGNAGPYQTLVPNVTSTFGSLPGGASGYSMCVFAGNACGQSNTKCIWVRGTVSVPSAITGNLTGCPNASYTYTVPPVAGAELYTWFVTGNDASLNGTGLTSVTSPSPSVVVDFAAPFTGATLSVYASLTCGYNSAARNMNIVRNPAIPGALSGLSYVCPNGSASYSVPSQSGVTYSWSCTVAGTVITPSGASASLLFPAIVPPGSQVCVSAVSGCGYASAQRCKGIASGLPNVPANVSGPSSGQCGATGVSFSIPPVSSATTYQWSVSNGSATILGPNNLSGITVDFSGSLNTVQLSVAAGNACGLGGVRTLTVQGNPSTPPTISGNNSVCNGSVESYTTPGSAGATSLNWQVPNGAVILGGQGSSNVLVLWGATSGTVRVTASNNCGSSGTRTLPVSVTCRESQLQNTLESEVKVFPNPAHDKLKVEIGALSSDRVNIQLINAIGEIAYSSEMNVQEGTNMMELNLENVAQGFYQLSVKGGTINTQHRVVVQ